MNRIRVAILDSGICLEHAYLKENIYGGIGILNKDGEAIIVPDYKDEYGHGTACASTIKSECNSVEFFVVKILDSVGESSLFVVEKALEYLLDLDVEIISMSISIITKMNYKNLENLCKKLNQQGKIITCSLENGKKKSMPAILDSVIGIRGHILEDEGGYWYNDYKKIQFIVDSNAHLHCDINGSYRMFGKNNSYAAARGAGIIANYLSQNSWINRKQLIEYLKKTAIRNTWTSLSFHGSKRFPEFGQKEIVNDKKIIEQVMEILIEFKNITDIDILLNFPLYHNKIGINDKECYELIVELEEKLDFQVPDYTRITRYDFFSIYRLAKFVEDSLG